MSRASKFFTESEKPEKTAAPKPTVNQKDQGGYWSRNQAERNIDIKRTDDGHVDMKASYYTVSIRLPRAWEEDLKKLAWARHISVTELFRKLAEEEIRRQEKYLAAIDDFAEEFPDDPKKKSSKK